MVCQEQFDIELESMLKSWSDKTELFAMVEAWYVGAMGGTNPAWKGREFVLSSTPYSKNVCSMLRKTVGVRVGVV